jgi:hypothetical protein
MGKQCALYSGRDLTRFASSHTGCTDVARDAAWAALFESSSLLLLVGVRAVCGPPDGMGVHIAINGCEQVLRSSSLFLLAMSPLTLLKGLRRPDQVELLSLQSRTSAACPVETLT